MRNDIRYALRTLAKNPAFTAIAVLTLGLGIGANTTIFSLINALLLRPLPYNDPNTLVAVDLVNGQSVFPWSYPMFEELRRDQRMFQSVAGFSELDVNLTGIDVPERLRCELVSASYFPLLGIDARLGRVFRPEEDREPNAHPLVLVGYDLWRRKFSADPGLIGRAIHIGQLPYTVIGVAPPGFKGQSGDIQIWVPITMAPSLQHIPKRLTLVWNFWLSGIARLNPGVSLAQAHTRMAPLARQIETVYPHPSEMAPWRVETTALAEAKTDPATRRSLLIMFGAVGFVLLMACMNMANLLTGRAMSRRREVAVRLAMGASRGALIRQFLTESLLLGLLGGVAGFFIAGYAIDLATALRPEVSEGFWAGYARTMTSESIPQDASVVLFTLAVSILAGLLFGLLPALQSSRLDLNGTLKNVTGRGFDGLQNLRRLNSRSVLIAGEMALAVVLLAGAGLMIESFARLLGTRIGASTDHVLTVSVELPPQQYPPEAAVRFQRQLLDSLASATGVQAASVSNTLPARGQTDVTVLRPAVGRRWEPVGVHSVTTGYFDVFHIPLLRGRRFTDRDRSGAQKVVLVSETAARRLWPGENPIGRRVLLAVWDAGEQDAEVAGIVGDVRYDGVERAAGNDVYVSFWQYPEGRNVVVRTAGDPMSAAPMVVRAVHALDKDLPVYGVQTMDRQLASATSRTRFSAVLLAVFAALALLLAAIGIYGVVSYSVAARMREIGIRMALGAKREDVFRMVLGDGLLLCLAGLLIGIPSALAVTRVLSSFLYDTKPNDPFALAAVSLLLTAVALIAAYVPARRAMNVDPTIALRYE